MRSRTISYLLSGLVTCLGLSAWIAGLAGAFGRASWLSPLALLVGIAMMIWGTYQWHCASLPGGRVEPAHAGYIAVIRLISGFGLLTLALGLPTPLAVSVINGIGGVACLAWAVDLLQLANRAD